MLTRTDLNIHIDAEHTREICLEIGERLREILRGKVSSELPPRLQYLMGRLAEADGESAPSLVPCLEDMIGQQPIDSPQESSDEHLA